MLQIHDNNGQIQTLTWILTPETELNLLGRIGVPDTSETRSYQGDQNGSVENYSTVTDLARFRGWSTLHPLNNAI